LTSLLPDDRHRLSETTGTPKRPNGTHGFATFTAASRCDAEAVR